MKCIRYAVAVLALAWVATLHAAPSRLQQLTVDNTSGGVGFLTTKINRANNYDPATQATCVLETAAIRYTTDGTTVTSSVGIPVGINAVLTIVGNDTLNNFRAIRTGGSSGLLSCEFSTP